MRTQSNSSKARSNLAKSTVEDIFSAFGGSERLPGDVREVDPMVLSNFKLLDSRYQDLYQLVGVLSDS